MAVVFGECGRECLSGPGNTVSDCDCPDCAPFCSTFGYCQFSQASGSTPCQNNECFTDDECYVEPKAILSLYGRSGCYNAHGVCSVNSCVFYIHVDIFPFQCDLPEGAFGDTCKKKYEECKIEEEEMLRRNDTETVFRPAVFGGSTLADVSALAQISLQVDAVAKREGRCDRGSCRNRAGLCCKTVQRSARRICPVFC
jgi:hypothetical protein